MEENNKKNEIVKAMTEVEYYPVIFEEEVSIEKYTKLPLTRVPALGIAFEPLAAAFQNVVNGGGTSSGLYRVTIPKGGHLAEFRNGTGYLGAVFDETGLVGQARLNPLICDPTMLLMAVVLAKFIKKLDSIQETSLEILEFLKQMRTQLLIQYLSLFSCLFRGNRLIIR